MRDEDILIAFIKSKANEERDCPMCSDPLYGNHADCIDSLKDVGISRKAKRIPDDFLDFY